ncbi:hypothetical protein [Liquorilactobacillus sicerae]|nr:hypothetical protein [Liquorilactobacillus sicerae]
MLQVDAIKQILKILLAGCLIVGGVLIGTTIFASKQIDNWGDKLQSILHH